MSEPGRPLLQVAAVSAKIGVIGFGGPAAHIAMLRREVVERRAWLDDTEFLELLGATSALPGPASTQMVIAVGRRRAGWRGLVVAGACFITPATAIVLLLAWLYVRYAHLPAVGGVLYGVKPVVVAVIAVALWGLGRGIAGGGPVPVVLALGAAGAFFAGLDPLVVIVVAAIATTLWRNRGRLHGGGASLLVPVLALATRRAAAAAPVAPARHASVPLSSVVLEFAKLGIIVFGSGYVLLAFLQRDVVVRLHWLTTKQLLDAVAAGQVTPGPVFTTATFVGYLTDGFPGALLATLAIFLPSFFLVAALVPLLPKVRRSPWLSGALEGVTAGALGLMAGVALRLAASALVDPLTAAVALVALAVLLRWRVNTAWVVLAGAGVGLVHSL